MNNRIKISIVTPSLNQGEFIEQAILSVLHQNYASFEHIIIDGGSGDRTVEIIKKYPHLIWISEPDCGQSDALNKGFKIATGEVIGWLNADDLYLPNCFQTIESHFLKFQDSQIVYGNYRLIDENGHIIQYRHELDFDLFMLKYLHVLYIPSTTTFLRRKIIEEGYFLNLEYHYAMDYEWILRLALKGYKFIHIPTYLADFRTHAQSKSSVGTEKQHIEQERALIENDPFLKKVSHIKLRNMIRSILLYAARTKRYLLKGLRGYYFTQWKIDHQT